MPNDETAHITATTQSACKYEKMYNIGKPATLLDLPQEQKSYGFFLDFGMYVVQLGTHTCIIFLYFFFP